MLKLKAAELKFGDYLPRRGWVQGVLVTKETALVYVFNTMHQFGIVDYPKQKWLLVKR